MSSKHQLPGKSRLLSLSTDPDPPPPPPFPPKVTGDFKDIIVNALLVLYKLMLNVNYILPQVARGRCFFQCLHTIGAGEDGLH